MGATALQATLVSVAFSVTGISAKIDKAATKVFGKDLVMLGNVLGAGYAMFNGGFDIGGTPDPTAMNVPTGAEAGDLFQSQMAAQGIAPTTLTTDQFNLSDMSGSAQPLTDEAWNAMGEANSAAVAEFAPKDGVVNAMTGEVGNVDSTLKLNAKQATANTSDTAAAQQPQGTGAASAQATAAQATDQIVPNATQAKAAADVLSKQLAPYQQPSNIFERMFYTTDKAGNKVFNDRLAGGVIQGVGSAAGGYMQSQEAAKGLDWQKQKYGARIGGRVTG